MSGDAVVEYEQHDLSMSRDPNVVLAEARKAAMALKDVISNKDKPLKFNGEQYIEFEDWQTLGKFYGITVKVVDTRPVQFGEVMGFEARAVAIHGPTGREISAAEAMCLNDEDKWSKRTKYDYRDGKRVAVGEVAVPLFQLKSMAQTRACAKAFRNVLAWIVVLAGYKPTPAEEMIDQGEETKKAVEPSDKPVAIKSVEDRVGKGPYKITDANLTIYSTFEDKIAEYAKKAATTGLPVVIVYEKDKFGYKILEMKDAQPASKQAERQPGKEG